MRGVTSKEAPSFLYYFFIFYIYFLVDKLLVRLSIISVRCKGQQLQHHQRFGLLLYLNDCQEVNRLESAADQLECKFY